MHIYLDDQLFDVTDNGTEVLFSHATFVNNNRGKVQV